jgi:hypothetical protein
MLMLVLVATVVEEAAVSHIQAYKLRTSNQINQSNVYPMYRGFVGKVIPCNNDTSCNTWHDLYLASCRDLVCDAVTTILY